MNTDDHGVAAQQAPGHPGAGLPQLTEPVVDGYHAGAEQPAGDCLGDVAGTAISYSPGSGSGEHSVDVYHHCCEAVVKRIRG